MAYIKQSISPKGISELLGPFYKLAANGWYFDQIYDAHGTGRLVTAYTKRFTPIRSAAS
jgi:hypothetical protein